MFGVVAANEEIEETLRETRGLSFPQPCVGVGLARGQYLFMANSATEFCRRYKCACPGGNPYRKGSQAPGRIRFYILNETFV